MNIKLEIIFFVFTGIMLLVGAIYIFRTEKRLRKFFSGKKGKDLEENIKNLEENISKLESAKNRIEKEITEINNKLKKSIRGLEAIRFNPFPDQGSNQSFAVGMLDEEGNGVVFSSLYSRERMSVFAKPIKKGKSEYELTSEERQVLEKAKV